MPKFYCPTCGDYMCDGWDGAWVLDGITYVFKVLNKNEAEDAGILCPNCSIRAAKIKGLFDLESKLAVARDALESISDLRDIWEAEGTISEGEAEVLALADKALEAIK